jgi:hypothetical protein
MWLGWGRGELYTWFWWGNLMKGGHFEDLVVDGRIILKWILNKSVGRSWTELIWLRIGRSGWLFRTGNKFDVQVTVHRDKCL